MGRTDERYNGPMKRTAPFPLALAAGLLLLPALFPASDGGWDAAALLRQRAAKDREFRTSPTSPMAGVVRLTVPAPGPKILCARLDGTVALQDGPGGCGSAPAACRVRLSGGRWLLDVGSETAVQPGAPVTLGRHTLVCYPAPDALTVLVFDPKRPQQLAFRGLRYFPPDPAWVVRARLERLAEPKPVRMLTTRNLQKTFYRTARVHFRIGDRALQLAAFKSALQGEEASALFIPFKDDTNGSSTYEVGRFLEIPEPPGTEFDLDFNLAFNPLCNYSPAYNCPLPPLENILEVGIPAGEQTYPGH